MIKPFIHFILNTMFHFWEEPPHIQQLIASLVPKLSSWELTLTRRDDYAWIFTIPFIKDEALCNGTEIVLDTYYENLVGETPVNGNQMRMSITTTKPDSYDTRITNPEFTDTGTYYRDFKTQMIVWLCPVLEVMFGHKPKDIYVSFTPIISG